MADLDYVGYWRLRSRNVALACVACVISVFLLTVFDVTIAARITVVVLFVLLLSVGTYCAYRYWRAFKDDEIAMGGSAKTAQQKWHRMHPPAD